MKNQYFGDIRDIFKFDLIENMLLDKSLVLKGFLYIIMLTKDGGNGGLKRYKIGIDKYYDEAKRQNKPGTQNGPLFKEMKKQAVIPSQDRNIAETMKEYYKDKVKNCVFSAIKEPFDKPGYLNKNYIAYFDIVYKELAKFNFPALFFLDPDTGLEPEKSKGYEYVSYETIRSLYDAIGDNSIVMIYQHGRQQHQNKLITLETITQNISHISDREIVFYFLTKDKKIENDLDNLLRQYKYKGKDGYNRWISTS